MTSDQRSSAENGIWLCQNCAKLIDNDPLRYSADIVRTWRLLAEMTAKSELENGGAAAGLALPVQTFEIDRTRLREVEQAFGELGDLVKYVLRRMLILGGLTLPDISSELEKARFSPDGERVIAVLKEKALVHGDFEGRWRIKPELEPIVRRCFEPPSLSARMRQLADEMLGWIAGNDGLVDTNAFEKRFRTRLNILSDKAQREHSEGDAFLSKLPSSAGGVKGIARALQEVASKIP